MQSYLIIILSLHVLAGVFWAGTTFGLARTGGAGAVQLFRPQMGAAAVAVLTGAYLWGQMVQGSLALGEKLLGVGVLCAIVAAGVQGAIGGRAIHRLGGGTGDEARLRSAIALSQRVAAGLLGLTVISMVASRYI
jgi:hypothetical protein